MNNGILSIRKCIRVLTYLSVLSSRSILIRSITLTEDTKKVLLVFVGALVTMIHGTLMVSISFILAFIQDQRKQQGVNEAASKRTIEKLNTILGLHNSFLN